MNHDVKHNFDHKQGNMKNKKLSFLGNENAIYDVLYIYFLDFNYPCHALFMSQKAIT